MTTLQRITAAGPLPALVVGSDDGPLLAAASGDRWLLGTAADRPEVAAVEVSLAADGLIAAPLEVEGRSLLVWTRLRAGTGRRDGRAEQLQAPLLGWRWQRGDQAWWGESLGQLESLDGPGPKGAARPQDPLEALAAPRRPCNGPSMVPGPATCWPPGSRGSASPLWPAGPSVTRWRDWPWP